MFAVRLAEVPHPLGLIEGETEAGHLEVLAADPACEVIDDFGDGVHGHGRGCA
jgi:hypothetical protein